HLLIRAKTETGYGECLCSTPALRLVIRERAGRYHLAVWPTTGHRHATACAFYRVDDAYSGRRFGGVATSDGAISVRLDRPLSLAVQGKPTEHSDGRSRRSASSTNATAGSGRVTLLGLLHLIWEEATLNTWNPAARRGWDILRDHLIDALATVNVDGVDLDTSCHLPPRDVSTDADKTLNDAAYRVFRSGLGNDGRTERFGLVLDEIRSVEPATSEHDLHVSLVHLADPLQGTPQLEARLRGSYKRAFAAVEHKIGRQFALCLVKRRDNRSVALLDMAVMVTNSEAIPVDSSYELAMADHIVASRRTVFKPLRYDRKEAVLPDFLLTDTDPATYVEVYGMTHA
ncbi:MAG: DUF1173 family protein, partial [Mycobacteriales bacterium]